MSNSYKRSAAQTHVGISSTDLPQAAFPKGGFKFSVREWAARRAAVGKPVTTLGAHKPRGLQKYPVLS